MTDCYCDAHCDTPLLMYLQGKSIAEDAFHVTLNGAERLGHVAMLFAFCTSWPKTEQTPRQLYLAAMENLQREAAQHADRLALCGSVEEIRQAWLKGIALAAVPALEGAEAINCDPGLLEQAYADGIRAITLTWNYENALGGSHKTGGGLTAQGREFVRRAQKLGILIDVSHGSDALFYDVCEIAEKPIAATHSNSRAVCPHSRNLTDDMFRCLVELHGFAGTNLYGPFLDGQEAGSLEAIRRHVEHFLDLGGEDCLCFGGDWDGVDVLPAGMHGVDGLAAIRQYLSDCGMTDTFLKKYTSATFLRVLQAQNK